MNNWTAWVGVKFGTLTVEKYLGYQDRGSAYFLVRCDCGKTKKVTIWEFKKGKEKSCGLLRCKAKVKGLTGAPKPPETITQQDETASANNNIKSTGSVIAKKVGGSATIILPDNQKLQLVTWKNDNMWVLYRPMRADEQAETYTYQEDSKFGLIEAKITIREVKR